MALLFVAIVGMKRAKGNVVNTLLLRGGQTGAIFAKNGFGIGLGHWQLLTCCLLNDSGYCIKSLLVECTVQGSGDVCLFSRGKVEA
jgi:hypothetical protein